MKQLTLGVVIKLVDDLKRKGYSDEQIAALPMYIGNDDELNGIHTAWYADLIDINNENDEYFVEMINGYSGNIQLTDRAILIS